MNLDKSQIKLLLDGVNLCHLLGVTSMAVSDMNVCGYERQAGIIVTAFGDYSMPDIGIGRTSDLRKKIKLLKSQDEYDVTTHMKTHNGVDIVDSLEFSNNRLKFSFRCAIPDKIHGYGMKKVSTTPVYSFTLTTAEAKIISESRNAMGGKFMKLKAEPETNRAIAEFSNPSGDMMDVKLDSYVSVENDDFDISDFGLTMNIQRLLPVLSLAFTSTDGEMLVNVLDNGILHIKIDEVYEVLIIGEVE